MSKPVEDAMAGRGQPHRPRQYEDVEVAYRFISPALAQVLLDLNTRNRPLNRDTVQKISRALQRDEFDPSNDAITVSSDGVLLNGQNRCTAAVQTGVGFWAILATGFDQATQLNMDTGKKRTFAQHLRIAYDEPQAEQKAAVSRAVWNWENGIYGSHRWDRPNPSMSELDKVWHDHRDRITEAAKAGGRMVRNTGASATAFGLAWYLFSGLKGAAEDLAYFENQFKHPSEVGEGSPLFALNRWATRLVSTSSDRRPTTDTQLALIIKAWNAFRDGKQMRNLSYRPGGANPEVFPTPK